MSARRAVAAILLPWALLSAGCVAGGYDGPVVAAAPAYDGSGDYGFWDGGYNVGPYREHGFHDHRFGDHGFYRGGTFGGGHGLFIPGGGHAGFHGGGGRR